MKTKLGETSTPVAMRRVLARLLLKDHSDFSAQHVTGLLQNSFDPLLGALLWGLLGKIKGQKAAESIAAFLAAKGYEPTTTLIRAALETGDHQSIKQLSEESYFISAVAGLLQADPAKNWPSFLRFRERNEEVAWKVVERLAEHGGYRDSSLVECLDEHSLGDLYTWTYRRVPPTANEELGKARFLGTPDHIEYLRNHALRRLVS